ncbi:OLC1v1003381C1 [Oldenlandia corymbosa var. corymbosa]|uniref:OLC1v1003381C1 n=1 Tax=Oldenlandia corymbosa var. corymbosa TaxID=529605 RepID=A0AAV1DAP9_OLDCO|nr:OLC1v1003381C1 [Oldenlandia corymbosa var. corymbosa]
MPDLLFHQSPATITTTCLIRSSFYSDLRLKLASVPSRQFIATAPSWPQQFAAGDRSSCRKCRVVKCMANPRRVKMVANQIRREISDMLLTDKVLQYAVLPEAALGADRYLSSLTTISDVEVSADLQVVKVYVSVFGDERGKEVAISGLKSKAKYVRSELGRRMKLRLTPEIRFFEDESQERGSRVIAILDKLKQENEEKQARFQGNDKKDEDGEDWADDGDDPSDDGIIYVD